MRGKDYYKSGNIINIEEVEEGHWCAEVEGSDNYDVNIFINNDNDITKAQCDCPHDNFICKHIAAVVFHLKDELKEKTPLNNKEKKPKKNIFESLIQSLSKAEIEDFLRHYALQNKNFKTELELYFSDKDERINVEEKYQELIKKLLRKHTSHGYIDYSDSKKLVRELQNYIKTGNDYINKNNFRDAFSLVKAILKPLAEVHAESDDSDGEIDNVINESIEILSSISSHDKASFEIKQQILFYIHTELCNSDLYFDYSDFGYDLVRLLQQLSVILKKDEIFITFIDAQIEKFTKNDNDYRREFYQRTKIEFLQQIGREIEANILTHESMDIVEIRQAEVNKAIDTKDYTKAKELIAGGIKTAIAKGHPGTEDTWKKELLRIAVLENDILTIRELTKNFAFDHGLSVAFYNQYKNTFNPDDWKIEIEEYISTVIQKTTKEWAKGSVHWRSAHPPLLQKLGNIYIQEKYLDRLLALVEKENNLEITLHYHDDLVKDYPQELLVIYLQAFEIFGNYSASRGQYKYLASMMKKVIKDIPKEKERVLSVANKLIIKYSSKPRRPAMLEELSVLF